MEKRLVDNVCEEQVFEGIYSKNSEVINNYFFYKFGHKIMAEESVQEAFIKLWENCKKVPFAKAKSYLYTVANNISLNKYKHQKVVLKYAKTEPQQTKDLQSPEYKMEEKEFKVKLEKSDTRLVRKAKNCLLAPPD